MSKILKMGISGIRSFGPDEQQKIEFYSPLTLILGQNGCGKTTIIESLKYVTTGDKPPGSGTGASFVHDPKLTEVVQIRGQVKLLMRDVLGKELTATRSLEATQKAREIQCKKLDATLTRKNPDGTKHSISNRCADIDLAMTNALGVSKPILNHVIFCHQEDSNWPLDEGKKVKEKFDAIFSATNYIKCLETIRKLRLEKKQKVKNMQEVLGSLKNWKDEATRKKNELRTSETEKNKIEEQIANLSQKLVPLNKRVEEILDIENNLGRISGDLTGKQHRLQSVRTSQKELKDSLSERFDCSDLELQQKLDMFQRTVDEKEAQLRRGVAKVKSAESDIQRKKEEESREVKKLGELESEHKRNERRIQDFNERLSNAVDDYQFSEYFGKVQFSDEQAGKVMENVENTIEWEKSKQLEKKKDFEQQEANIQGKITELSTKQGTLEHVIKERKEQIDKASHSIRKAKKDLMSYKSDLSGANLKDIEREKEQLEKDIAAEERRVNTSEVNKEIENLKSSQCTVEHEFESVKKLVKQMTKEAEARSQYDMNVNEVKKLKEKIEHLKRKREDDIEQLLGENRKGNLKNELEARIANLRDDLADLDIEKQGLSRTETKLETQIKSCQINIEKKEEEIKEMKRKIDSICQGENLESTLDKTNIGIENLSKECGNLSSSITVLRRFISKLGEKNCCPLCHRDFPSNDDVTQLQEELESKISRIPSKLGIAKDRLSLQKKRYDEMLQLKPQQERVNKTIKELDTLRQGLESDKMSLKESKEKLEAKQTVIDMIKSDQDVAQTIQPDVITIDNNQKKIQQLTDLIEDLKVTLGSSDNDMSLEEAMGKQTELDEKTKKLRAEIENKRECLMDHNKKLQSLMERKNKAVTKELEIKKKEEDTQKLQNDITKYEEDKKRLTEEMEKAQESVTPIKYEVDSKNKEKANITKEKENYIEKSNKEVQSICEKQRELRLLKSNIKSYKDGKGDEKVEKSKNRVNGLKAEVNSLEATRKDYEEENKQIEREITNQKERKRNLDDEKKIRDKEVEARKLEEDIRELKHKIKDYAYEKMVKEKEQLQHDLSSIEREINTSVGRKEEMSKTIQELRADLKRKEFANAEKDYKSKLIEIKCTDAASDDLNKYYKALDTAIMKFHAEKMTNINRIIRELWRNTYRGNDIDYIEIKTHEAESKGADKRRTYDYRVVMMKRETEIDMRKRCSAGQKVLASLIIRMALAETFSSNCGILALDEPTTNLDRENIDALSLALLNIVNKRYHQRNFQLVVITHDTDFLDRLARADYIEHYFKVDRNERGLSTIVRQSVSHI
ncbi:DNA repair protein RAD50-like [Oratosquilla oratoria]|uniref:DNA repair protein RAD50-like n=1 Tax=Oratosquilla oratoria TaxID=337810 RepID=UPI003F759DCF